MMHQEREDTHRGLKLIGRLEVIRRHCHCQVPGHALQLTLILPPSLQDAQAGGLLDTSHGHHYFLRGVHSCSRHYVQHEVNKSRFMIISEAVRCFVPLEVP